MLKSIYITFAFLLTLFSSSAQIITTVAGNGLSGYGGDGGPATNANMVTGGTVSILPSGDVLLGTGLHIRKLSTTGSITLFAGNNDTTGATCRYMTDGLPATTICPGVNLGIINDAIGNVYFSDGGRNAIRKVDTRGIVTTIAGSLGGVLGHSGDGGPATAALLYNPYAMAMDRFKNIYFGEQGYIRKIDSNGIITTIAGVGGFFTTCDTDGVSATACQIGVCLGMATDTMGNLYFSDQDCNKVRKLDRTGIITTIAGNGVHSFWGDGGTATATAINIPHGLYVNKAGTEIIFAEFFGNRIRRVNSAGIISSLAGNGLAINDGDGGPATAAKVFEPRGLGVASNGDIYLTTGSATEAGTIRRIRYYTSIPEVSDSTLQCKLFPNPSSGQFSIEFPDEMTSDAIHLRIYNSLGAEVLHQTGTKAYCEHISTSLPPGLYQVLITASGRLFRASITIM